jgi:hypothetical protein
MIGILLYFIAAAALYLFLLWLTVIGFEENPGYLTAYRSGALNELTSAGLAYCVLETAIVAFQFGYSAYLLSLVWRCKRRLVPAFAIFFCAVVVLGLVNALTYTLIFDQAPDVMKSGTGLVIMLGVYQYFVSSPLAKATLVR